MPNAAVDLKVAVVPQGAPVDGLIGGILDTLGIDHSPPASEAVCVIDTRAREVRDGPSNSSRRPSTVYFDDFLQPARLLLATQGRPEPSHRLHADPEISASARRLFQSICSQFWTRGFPLVAKSFWPHDAVACLVLTHDVDWLSYSPAHRAVSKGKPIPEYLKLLLSHAAGRRFGFNVASTIELEASLGARSTFLFRNEYPGAQEKLSEAIRICLDSGCEVALHAAKKSHKDPLAMIREKSEMEKAIGGPLSGLREHALKFEYDKTWKCIEGAGFAYDMTFGLNEKTGFVGGLCHPYHPVALDGTPYSFLEIPTSLMDWTLLRDGMSYGRIETLIRRLKDSMASLNGCLCVNFHNTYLDKDLFPEIERAYRLLIAECKEKGFWIATARECAEWWAKREGSQLKASIEEGSLNIDSNDPSVPPNVYWPDGRVEQLGQLRQVKGLHR